MIRFLADENFDNEIVRGVQRRVPEAEFLRVQDTDLAGQPDCSITRRIPNWALFPLSNLVGEGVRG